MLKDIDKIRFRVCGIKTVQGALGILTSEHKGVKADHADEEHEGREDQGDDNPVVLVVDFLVQDGRLFTLFNFFLAHFKARLTNLLLDLKKVKKK